MHGRQRQVRRTRLIEAAGKQMHVATQIRQRPNDFLYMQRAALGTKRWDARVGQHVGQLRATVFHVSI